MQDAYARHVYQNSYTPACQLRGVEARPFSKLITDHRCHQADTGSTITLVEFIRCETMHVICTEKHLSPKRHLKIV